ncbi:MAG: SPOR domain-containing protein [Alphaproteobacteria bacterium]
MPERPTASFEDQGSRPDGAGQQGWWKWLLAALSFLLFIGILYYAYSSGTGSDGGPIRTVNADPEPFKVRPEDPGGQKIPDQDKLIYGEAVGRPAETPETLARPSEEPIDRIVPPPPAPKPVERTASQAPKAAGKAPEQLQAPQQAATPTPNPKTEQPAPTQPEPAAPGVFRVQIGSFQTQEAADAAWARIAPKHSSIVAGAAKHIKQVDLISTGKWYRLQFGSYTSREAADAVCAELKAAGQDCLVDGA